MLFGPDHKHRPHTDDRMDCLNLTAVDKLDLVTREICPCQFEHVDLGGGYRILCVSERFLSLILLGGEILVAAAEIACSQSWDYRLRSQKEQLLGKAECLANCSECIGLL